MSGQYAGENKVGHYVLFSNIYIYLRTTVVP